MRIYLDTCCLSRIFDDQTQIRIHQETEVIQRILNRLQDEDWLWISSTVLVREVEGNPNEGQRSQIESWLTDANQNVVVDAGEVSRGKYLESISFKKNDALHLACAESGSADVFLTTDDNLLKKAKSVQTQLNIQVDNPYEWLQKVRKNEDT